MVSLSKSVVCAALLLIATLSQAESSRPPVVHTATVEACTFRLMDRLGGEFTDDFDGPPPLTATIVYKVDLKRMVLPHAISIDFSCLPPGTDFVAACRNLIGVDKTSHGWVAWNALLDGPIGSDARLEVREIRSINGSGAVRLQNYTYTSQGDRDPYRSFGFCLKSPNGITLYGVGSVDTFHGKHKSVEPEVMQLLRSIEFIDAPDDGLGAAPAAGSSPPASRY